ncbi:hypothetical protein NDS46_31055 (plasmid) [Paenibacillus thiaminolyticus]|uniref:hypothetical protein n=1 Tax=Paenibacillus thiaminolyticus TaxID=49283 RepID=UPI002330BC4A|nr:hypothetical protein [Paenibacillus thiaminolyticus]WCF11397.1 hypothetical protein NDS46_31055 [Paenibacillus thiaminolyticus]
MGLDIKVYKNLKEVQEPKFDEYGDLLNMETEWKPGESMEWSEKHFPGRGQGIESQRVYNWEDSFRFRAGSHSAYSWWRDKLNEFMGDTAFQELINFADNEGVIGPVVSKKLAKDFAENLEKAREFSNKLNEEGYNGTFWIESYENWKEAFEMAAHNGAVEFR